MTIVGEAFVAISPEGAGFATKLQSQLKAAGLDNVGLAVGAGLAAGVVVGLGAIGQAFQKERQQITQETGATGAQLTGLANTATQAFREVPVSLGAAATAVDELYRRGVPLGAQLDRLAEQELFLAKVAKTDLGDAVSSTTGLFQRFNIPISDQSRELDVLFKAYQQSGQGLDVLTGGLQSGGAVLQQFGFNLDQSAALLAGLEKASVNLQPALAGLRLAFGQISKEGGDPKVVLGALFKEFEDGTPKTKAAGDAIRLFGTRSGSELTVALEKGSFDISKMFKIITDGKGGIIATGLSTLTLGDQFKLLRNNAEANLAPIGTTILQGVEHGLSSLSLPIENLIGSFAHLVTVVAPAAADLRVVFAPLVLVAPLVNDLATGVNLAASALSHLPAPVVAVAAAVGIGALAYGAYTDATLTAVAASVAFDAVQEFALGPIGLTIGVLTLAGAAFHLFSAGSRQAAADAKAMQQGLFDASGGSGIFANGITTATVALKAFDDQQIAAGKDNDLRQSLLLAGSDTSGLVTALGAGGAAWKTYKADAVASAQAVAGQNILPKTLIGTAVSEALNNQAKAFTTSAQSELNNAVATDQLSAAQERHIIRANTDRAGVVNYAGALDDLNTRLTITAAHHDAVTEAAKSTQDTEAGLAKQIAAGSITDAQATNVLKGLGLSADDVTTELAALKAKAEELNEVQDLQVNKTLTTTAAYGKLSQQVALGNITQADAIVKLEGMGLSASGASTAFSTLQSAVQSFVQGALSQIPTVGTAISDFSQTLTSDQSKLQSDVAQSGTLHERLNAALANAASTTASKLSAVNLSISQDQARIASGSVSTTDKLQTDLARRSTIITGSGKASVTLQQDIAKNNAAITADYKKLADDNDPNRFTQNILKNAENVAKFTANLQTLVSEHFGALAGQLAQQGPTVAGGLAAGLANDKSKAALANTAQILSDTTAAAYKSFLEQKFPELTGTGDSAGQQIGKGIADGIVSELDRLIPGLLPVAADGGKKVGVVFANNTAGALHAGLGAINLQTDGSTVGTTFANGAAGAIHSTLGQVNVAGQELGKNIDLGVSTGVDANKAVIGDSLVKVARYGINIANLAFGVSSPSKVMAVLGGFIAEGLAVGISGGALEVGTAAAGLSASVTAGIGRVDPTGAFSNLGASIGQSLASGVTSSSGNVSDAAAALVSQIGALSSTTLPALQLPAPVVAPIPVPVVPTPVVPPVVIARPVVPAPVVAPIHLAVPVVPAPIVPVVSVPVTVQAPVVPAIVIPTPRVPAPVVPTVTFPQPVVPAPVLPAIHLPAPTVPAPVVAPFTVPVPVVPTPVVPVVHFAVPVVPTPVVPPVTFSTPVVPTPVVPTVTIPTPLIARPTVPAPFVVPVTVPATVARPVVPTPVVPVVSISAVVGRPVVPAPVVPTVTVPVTVATPVVPAPKLDAKLSTIGPQLSSSVLAGVTLASTSASAQLAALSGQLTNSFSASSFEGVGEKIGANVAAGIKNTSGLSKEVTAQLVAQIMATLEAGLESPKQKANLLKLLTELGSPLLRFAPPAPSSPIQIAQAAQSLPVAAPQDRADAQAQQDKARAARGPFDGAQVIFQKEADPVHIANALAWKFLT